MSRAQRTERTNGRVRRGGQGLVEPAPEPTVEPSTPQLDELTKTELVELAEQRGLDSSGTKAELVERLTDAADS